MKIYSKIVISMTTLEVVEEESFEWEGEIAELKGASGAIDYPDFQEDIQVDWLTGGTKATPAPSLSVTLESVMDTGLGTGGNPYQDESPYDPTFDVERGQGRFEEADALAKELSPVGDWEKFADAAAAKLDTIFVLEDEITNEVNNFEKNIRRRRSREISRWAGGMADINAVESSQFVIGMALREGEVTSEVNEFETKLRLEFKRSKVLAVLQGISDITRIMLFKVDSNKSMTQLQNEINRVNIIARKEQRDRQIEIDSLQATWDLEVFQYGMSMLGSLGGGGAQGVKGLSKSESALSGAATGASIGAELGVPGAIAGGLIGGIGGFFTGG